MSQQQTALEHLRVIRSLLERSQVYRAVSAPAALFGGLLALAVSLWTIKISLVDFTGRLEPRQFLAVWLGILAVTTALNVILLKRQADARQQPFVSDGMRAALRAFIPPMLVGGVLGSLLIWFNEDVKLGSLVWILCYGLALLSTSHFSPRSLVRLGWMCVAAGLLLAWRNMSAGFGYIQNDEAAASLFMGLTFGLLHIVYAVAVFVRKPKPLELSPE